MRHTRIAVQGAALCNNPYRGLGAARSLSARPVWQASFNHTKEAAGVGT